MEDTLRDESSSEGYMTKPQVLILVLMEDTLRVRGFVAQEDGTYVLILVLMEDTLRDYIRLCLTLDKPVLILVLMEDTLRGT